jgi:hypothetical protein
MAKLKTVFINGEKAILFPIDTYNRIMNVICEAHPEYKQKLLVFTRTISIRHWRKFHNSDMIAVTFKEYKKLQNLAEFVI